MGIQASRSINDIKTEAIQRQVVRGGKLSSSAVIKGDVSVVVRNIQGRGLRVNIQNATVSSRVVFDGLVKEFTDLVQQNRAAAEGGFGIQISDAESFVRSYVEQIQQTECGDISVSQVIEGNVNLTVEDIGAGASDTVVKVQEANAMQECLFNAIAEGIQTVEQETEAKSTGASLLGLLFGPIGGIIGLVIAVIIGIMVFSKISDDKKKSDSTNVKKGGGWLDVIS
jgi:hypothetical protein